MQKSGLMPVWCESIQRSHLETGLGCVWTNNVPNSKSSPPSESWEMSMVHCSAGFECIRTFWCQQESDYKVVTTPEFPCAQVAPRMGRAPADCHSTIFSEEDLVKAS